MMVGIREFIRSPKGKGIAIALAIVGISTGAYSARNFLVDENVSSSTDRMYVCAETMKPFEHTVRMGEKNPVDSPHTGKATGYPGEPCYWSADGSIRERPTWVLLNHWTKKQGPTFCPDCGRLVVAFNAVPSAGQTPPPTQAEYRKPAANPSDEQ
jgi:hypothetical protein